MPFAALLSGFLVPVLSVSAMPPVRRTFVQASESTNAKHVALR
jgi:hypothetical protein